MDVKSALAWARAQGVDRLDAHLLLSHHLQRERAWLMAHDDDVLAPAVRSAFEHDVLRRADQMPLAYLTGFVGARSLGSTVVAPRRIASSITVLKARRATAGAQQPFAPAPIDEVVATIRAERPQVVFTPHVETAAGMILPDDYLRAVAEAVHAHGGLFVLDCVASGAMWVDMRATGVDILVSAPQKGWSSTPCAGLVMLGDEARARIDATTSSSFSMDLKKWLSIMETHEQGKIAYHATLPTDGLAHLRDAMQETAALGFAAAKAAQQAIGQRVRALLEARGIPSVAAPGFQAPCVIVSYTDRDDFQNTQAFIRQGLQIAAGVPLACDEGADFKTFRIGLFGLDKLQNADRTVASFERALDAALALPRT